ncbi:MAG TPA: hypothetical protein VER79_06460 [Candidatus Limnocylindrales bacterium]|nr:hypothetical protein [Candidatus Limnocylindrales bacterium]
MARRKAHRLDREEHQPAPIPGATPAVQSVPPSQLQLLHSSIGNRAVQRLLEKPPTARPAVVQRGMMSDLWDMAASAASSAGAALAEAGSALSDPGAAISTASAGETMSVTDADARLRTDPPELKNTGATFHKGSNVRILQSTTKDGLRYVHVEEVMGEGVFGPPLSGWTRRSNLDLSGASGNLAPETIDIKTPGATGPADVLGLPAAPPIMHPAYQSIIDLLKVMEASPVPIETKHKEEVGDERQQRLQQIAEVRDRIAVLTPAVLGVPEDVFQAGLAYLNRRLRPQAPYYNQNANTNMLASESKAGWERTCNVAVPAMLIEGLGKTRDDYDNRYGDVAFLQQIFDALEGKFLKRKFYESAADFEALRLPDFMALVGIARKMPKGASDLNAGAFDKAVGKARNKAADSTIAHATMTTLLEVFGATVTKGGVHANALGKIGDARRDYTRILLGAGNEDREAKKAKYEALDADALLKVSTYRNSVLKAVNPLLDTGAQILVGMESHFVRRDALDEDAVQIDDPGYASLKNARLTWQQARDFGMFKGFWSVTA